MIKTKQVDDAAQVRSHHAGVVDAIRRNPQLTDAGKRQQISAATDEAQAAVRGLKAQHRDGLAKRREALDAKLFGTARGLTGSAMISYRDAADRAEQVKSADAAQSMMRRAVAAGDAEVAAALAHRAVELADSLSGQGWADVFNQWLDTRRATLPDVDDVVAELSDIDADLRGNDLLTFALSSPPETAGRNGAWSAVDASQPQTQHVPNPTAGALIR